MEALTWLFLVLAVVLFVAVIFAVLRRRNRGGSVLASSESTRTPGKGT